MAKGLKGRISEVPVEPTVHVGIPVKDLPPDVKKRHLARKKKIEANHKANDKLFKEGEEDIKKLVKRIKDAKV